MPKSAGQSQKQKQGQKSPSIKTVAVLNFMKCGPNSIIASNRIARYLAEKLDCPLIDVDPRGARFDKVYVVNGPLLFCSFRDEARKLIEAAKEVIWVGNDYTLPPPKWVKEKNPIYLVSFDNIWKSEKHSLVNWNQLTCDISRPVKDPVLRGLCYYGAFRKDREKYFRKYLGSSLYGVNISSSKAGVKKFLEFCPRALFFTATDIVEALSAYESTLYIEDEYSHEAYTCPANRFYEGLSAGTLMLFEESVIGTFDRAKIDIKDWIVDSPEDVANALAPAVPQRLRRKQLEKLRTIDYAKNLGNELREAMTHFGL